LGCLRRWRYQPLRHWTFLSHCLPSSIRVTRRAPKIGVAGLVSPANSWKREFLSAALRTHGRTEWRSRHAAGGSQKAKFGSPVSTDLLSVRSSNLDGWKAMQLKHLNLTTSDVAALAAFFERFFGFRRSLERGSGAFSLMSNDEDFVLTLMKAKKHDPVAYPETFHVGFYVDDAATVRAKRDELTVAGFSPGEIHDAGRHGRGAHFYCTAPGNVVVEIAMPPQLQAAEAG
jgi:catechol 2,3-dioxygenase-like lactoylglutathione lyase family enzyme